MCSCSQASYSSNQFIYPATDYFHLLNHHHQIHHQDRRRFLNLFLRAAAEYFCFFFFVFLFISQSGAVCVFLWNFWRRSTNWSLNKQTLHTGRPDHSKPIVEAAANSSVIAREHELGARALDRHWLDWLWRSRLRKHTHTRLSRISEHCSYQRVCVCVCARAWVPHHFWTAVDFDCAVIPGERSHTHCATIQVAFLQSSRLLFDFIVIIWRFVLWRRFCPNFNFGSSVFDRQCEQSFGYQTQSQGNLFIHTSLTIRVFLVIVIFFNPSFVFAAIDFPTFNQLFEISLLLDKQWLVHTHTVQSPILSCSAFESTCTSSVFVFLRALISTVRLIVATITPLSLSLSLSLLVSPALTTSSPPLPLIFFPFHILILFSLSLLFACLLARQHSTRVLLQQVLLRCFRTRKLVAQIARIKSFCIFCTHAHTHTTTTTTLLLLNDSLSFNFLKNIISIALWPSPPYRQHPHHQQQNYP